MGPRRRRDAIRDWLGTRAFRLACWLYRLPHERTYFETEDASGSRETWRPC